MNSDKMWDLEEMEINSETDGKIIQLFINNRYLS